MAKRLLAIYLVLVVLVAGLIPGCTGATTGTIEVKATLDGAAWTGAVQYTLTGPAGTSAINGTSVDDTFIVTAGSWACAYVSGGPGTFVNITPSATQSVAVGETKTFTLNFVTPAGPTQVDVSIEFVTWSINGTPVPPGIHFVGPGAIIDAHFKKHVSGAEEGAEVPVKQTDWLDFHNNGYEGTPGPVINLHCVNAWGAVTTDPPSDKISQQATVGGDPVAPCYTFAVEFCQHVLLDVETEWEQKICTNYTKKINWIGLPNLPQGLTTLDGVLDVVFEIQPPIVQWQSFDLVTWACVEVGEGYEDTNPDNDCTKAADCPPLTVIYSGPSM
jgi:hypothetical protein